MSRITRILKVAGIGALLIGATVGLTACGPSAGEYQRVIDDKAALDLKNKAMASDNLKLIEDNANLAKVNTETEATLALNQAEIDAKNLEIAKLQAQIVVEAEAEVSAENTYILDELAINSEFTETFSDKELEIVDGKVTFDGDEYDVEEFVSLTATPNANGNDYNENVLLIVKEGDLSYFVNLDSGLDTSLIDEDEPLELSFLGEDTKIIDWNVDEVTFSKGTEVSILEGETKDGVTVTFVADGKAKITVGTESKTIYEGDSYKFNDLDVKVKEVMYQDYAGGVHAVELEIGDDVEFTVEDGDEYAEDSIFEYSISANSIGLVLKESFIETDVDEDFKALSTGMSIEFPKYLAIEFAGLSTEDVRKVTLETVEKSGATYIKAKGLFTVGMEDFDKVYIDATGIYDEDLVLLGTEVEIDNTEMSLVLNAGNIEINDIVMPLDLSAVSVDGLDISSKDVKYRTNYGIVISDPENSIEDEEFSLEIPEEQLTASVKVKLI